MSAVRRFFAGEVVLSLILLAAVLGVDFLWVRPQRNELHQLTARRTAAGEALRNADASRAQELAVLEHLGEVEAADWKTIYAGKNPLTLLEDLRKEARLRSLDVSLDERKPAPPFERTTYYMSVYGSFTRQIRFLKALESARPMVIVDALTMDTREADPQVTLKLNVSVLTLAGEGSGP